MADEVQSDPTQPQPQTESTPELELAQPAEDAAVADQSEQTDQPLTPEVAFSWQASEFVHHHKSFMWYVILIVLLAVPTAIAAWLHLWLEIGVFLTMGAAIIVYANKPPRTLLYELSDEGVHVDNKLYQYAEFRSFGVVEDEEWHSIDLEPAKRFALRLVLLYDPTQLDGIIEHLERHLPREDRELDLIEKITKAVRF